MLTPFIVFGVVLATATASALPSLGLGREDNRNGTIWAVLVAGSSGYSNYRHQADVCHAYQIFRRHGIPDSQIIVMMYDDIAFNPGNPKQGKIFNKPKGVDVYRNVPKDYTHEEVTPATFVHVLTGNHSAVEKVGSGKVLRSGPDDHVFVNFADHGATGMIGFPQAVMYADDLLKALETMHQKKMYKKLVFYMEACESGSMFNGILPPHISVLATTAANPNESSYACYFDSTLNTYLGDEFSVAWMEDIDSEEHFSNQTTETFQKQFDDVLKRVHKSHPQIYGETDMEEDLVVDYLGKSDTRTSSGTDEDSTRAPFKDSVSSRDVPLHILTHRLMATNDIYEFTKLMKKRQHLVKQRKMVDQLFYRIMLRAASQAEVPQEILEANHVELSLEMMPCYKTLVENFKKTCINIHENTYTLSHLYKLANLCTTTDLTTEEVSNIYSEECSDATRAMLGVD